MKGDRECFELEGVIAEELPGGHYRVRIGAPLNREVLARLCGRMTLHRVRVLPGDVVTIEVSPYDLTRGRITYRGVRRERQGAA